MLKRIPFTSLALFLTPILLAAGIFALINPGCRSQEGPASGFLKLLYTSEVGGRLDPCG